MDPNKFIGYADGLDSIAHKLDRLTDTNRRKIVLDGIREALTSLRRIVRALEKILKEENSLDGPIWEREDISPPVDCFVDYRNMRAGGSLL